MREIGNVSLEHWRRRYNVVHAGSAHAVDGDFWTGWRTMQDQVPGQWFAVEMGQIQAFDSIVLDKSRKSSDFRELWDA